MAEPHIRAAQLADSIRDYLAVWITREYPGSFVGVAAVTLSENQRVATAWLQFLQPDPTLLKKIKKNTRRYQKQLQGVIQRFRIPELRIEELAEGSFLLDLPS